MTSTINRTALVSRFRQSAPTFICHSCRQKLNDHGKRYGLGIDQNAQYSGHSITTSHAEGEARLKMTRSIRRAYSIPSAQARTRSVRHNAQHSTTATISTPLHHRASGTMVGRSLTHRAHTIRACLQICHKRSVTTNSSRATPDKFGVEILHPDTVSQSMRPSGGVRDRLRRWQEINGSKLAHQIDATDISNLSKDVLDLKGQPLAEVMKEGDTGMDSERYDDHDAELGGESVDEFAKSVFLLPGALCVVDVAHAGVGAQTLAIFTQKFAGAMQLWVSKNNWSYAPLSRIRYIVPDFLDAETLAALLRYAPGEQHLRDRVNHATHNYDVDPLLAIPRSLAALLHAKLSAFDEQGMKVYRQHAATLDQAHGKLAHSVELRAYSLKKIASSLINVPENDLTDTQLYAVIIALLRSPFRFQLRHKGFTDYGIVFIAPKGQVRSVELAAAWLRDWQEVLARRSNHNKGVQQDHSDLQHAHHGVKVVEAFVVKARRIIKKSRRNREANASGFLGPSKLKRSGTSETTAIEVITDETIQFTDEEQILVEFLQHHAMWKTFERGLTYEALAPLLLHATGMYEGMQSEVATFYMMLQELGVVVPYEFPGRYNQLLALPHGSASRAVRRAYEMVHDSYDMSRLKDTMEHLRHDFGDLPVYCIDKTGTIVVDDGISVEQRSDGTWVHIHIANPTAFFDHADILAKMARHMTETMYFVERAYSMLPQDLIDRLWSLAPNRPTLTFSALLDAEGDILKTLIRPGIIRNVHHIDPAELSQTLDQGKAAGQKHGAIVLRTKTLPTDETSASKASDTDRAPLPSTYASDMHLMGELSRKRLSARIKKGGIRFGAGEKKLYTYDEQTRASMPLQWPVQAGGRQMFGDPVIEIHTQKYESPFTTQRSQGDQTVEELMLLTSEIAASWCADRDVPIVYRGSTVSEQQDRAAAQYWETKCRPWIESAEGVLPAHIGIPWLPMRGNTLPTMKPIKHKVLGLDLYTKVTSPLRRYGDMITHWQIEAQLRKEAGTQVAAAPARAMLPASSLEAYMLELYSRERLIKSAKVFNRDFWICSFMARAFHFKEFDLPNTTFTVYIAAISPINVYDAALVEYNFPVQMVPTPEILGSDMRVGDTWEAVVGDVTMMPTAIYMKPVRLMHRYDE